MKKYLRYDNDAVYILGTGADIYPADVEPVEEIDLTEATKEEIAQLKRNPHNNGLLNKIKQRKK